MRNRFEFSYINLDYVEEVSDGDRTYERDIITLFISVIPQNLSSLIKQFEIGSFHNVKRILRHIQCSTGIMGLNDKLRKHMDAIVAGNFKNKMAKRNMEELSLVCLSAVEEAKSYLNTLE
ncbi:MAG: hypothetical protein EOO47_03565 [Flavobacterium sp.]|nr:MAG: hypothetical protein EOO47_03565 [Flavobacterium sp.]